MKLKQKWYRSNYNSQKFNCYFWGELTFAQGDKNLVRGGLQGGVFPGGGNEQIFD